jgi:hypothetical protein
MLTAAALGASCAGLQAGSIGLNFVNNGDGGVQSGASDALGASEQAGAPGFEQVNWNNLGRWGGGVDLVDSTGTSVGVKAWWDSNNTWNTGIGLNTPDEKLMYGYLDATGQIDYNQGTYQFWWNENKPEVYVEGLSAWMASLGAVDYDVIVYADGDSTDGRKAEYWLQQSASASGDVPTALGPDLSPHVFLGDSVNFADAYEQVPLTASSMDNIGYGNFIVFPNIGSDNFIVRTEERYVRALINAIQIVPHFTATSPSIVTDVSPIVRYSGWTATFNVSAVGTPPLNYQWMKGGANIDGATNASLVLTNLALTDDGTQYSVKISNTAGSVTSGIGSLTVLDSASAKYIWSAPVVITNVEDVLTKPGVITGAASFGAHEVFVTNGSTVVHFTTDGSVATTTGNGVATDANVFTGDTGNAQLNEVLDYFSYDGGPKTITLNNLVPGLKYSVQLFAMDNRNISLGGRTAYFVDPNDENDFSATLANRDQSYVMGAFTATAASETIKMVLPYDNNGALNAAIVRVLQTAPAISINPMSVTVYRGQNVTLTSLGIGGAPLGYQWRKNGAAITGETNASLTLSNVQTTANYDVVVSNEAGSATSTAATVTVLTVPSSGTFASAVMANGPLAYWRLNEDTSVTNVLDYVRGNNGYYGTAALWGNTMGIQGPRPPSFTGFESGNTALQCAGTANSFATIPALNLQTNSLTVVAWINPSQAQASYTGIVMSRDGVAAGLGFGENNELIYTWNGDSTWAMHSGLIVPQNEWSMVVLVIEPTQGTLYMGNVGSGLKSSITQLAHVIEKWTGMTRIGGDAIGDTRTFVGNIDEVAVFNHALTKDQITAMWAAGRASGNLPPVIVQNPRAQQLYTTRPATFTVSATVSGSVSYQWKKDGVALTDGGNVAGSTTATLKLSSVSAADNGNYTVDVANNAGSVTSEPANLTVVAPSGKAFEAAVIQSNPLGYWRFSEVSGTNAFDKFGGMTGTYYAGVSLGQPGNTTTPFETDNYSINTVSGREESFVTVPPLSLNGNTMTVVAWIMPSMDTEPANCGLFFQREGVTVSGLTYDGTGTKLSYTWNNEGNTYGWDSGLIIPASQWVFTAMVIEPTKATLYVGANGALSGATHVYSHVAQPFDRTSYIGNDPGSAAGARTFDGLIDEVMVAGRAYSGEEISQLFAAGAGVIVPPQIVQQPVGVSAYAGKTAQLFVTASGSPTLNYQWYKGDTALVDSTNIIGSKTPTLTIVSTTPADAGSYKAVVSNSAGSATSSVAILNIGALTGKAYETAIIAGNPVGYWRFNEIDGSVAYDYVGGHNATYGDALTRAVPGPVTSNLSGFESDNIAFQTTGVTNSYVTVPALSLRTNTVTIIAWINPTDTQPDYSGIVFTRGDDVGGLHFRTGNELGYTWNDNGSTYGWSSGIVPPLNQWSMVALVVSPTNALLYMGTPTGVVVGENKLAHANEGWTSAVRIGGDSLNSDTRTTKCQIDEVAIYNYSMTDADVRNLFTQATGGVTPDVTLSITQVEGNVNLSWSTGTLLQADTINGTWTPVDGATSPYTVDPTAAQKYYRVLVK